MFVHLCVHVCVFMYVYDHLSVRVYDHECVNINVLCMGVYLCAVCMGVGMNVKVCMCLYCVHEFG